MIKKKIYDKIFLFQNEFGSKTYYIQDKKKLLIDAGVFVNEKVDIIILTHCHYDHILFLEEIKRKNKCEVMCGENDKEDIEQITEKTLFFLSPKKLRGVKITKPLKEGEKINIGTFIFEVLETPGHTSGSISLFERNKKILFSGDTWFGNNFIGRTDFPSGDEKTLLSSVSKLKKLSPQLIFPGH